MLDSMEEILAVNLFHAVKKVAAPQLPMAIKHPEQCFRVVSRTLKHSSGCFMGLIHSWLCHKLASQVGLDYH